MKKLRVLLIIIAVVCIGVAVSYPITHYIEQQSNEDEMEELSALRDSVLADIDKGDVSRTAEPSDPYADAAPVPTSTTDGEVQSPLVIPIEDKLNTATAEQITPPPHETPYIARSAINGDSAGMQTAAPTNTASPIRTASAGPTAPTTDITTPEPASLTTEPPTTEPVTTANPAVVISNIEQASNIGTSDERPINTYVPPAITVTPDIQPTDAVSEPTTEPTEEPVSGDEPEATPHMYTLPTRRPETPAPTQPEVTPYSDQSDVIPHTTADSGKTVTDGGQGATLSLPPEFEAYESSPLVTPYFIATHEPVATPEPDDVTVYVTTAPQAAATEPDTITTEPEITPYAGPTETPDILDYMIEGVSIYLPTPAPTPKPLHIWTVEATEAPDRYERDSALSYNTLEKKYLDESKILPELKQLYEINHDLVGWIYIEGTNINFPVVQTEQNDYYLKRDFRGNDNSNGQIILDAKCDPYTPSYNLVISGHHMNSGAMFGRLPDYKNEDYWREHKIVEFDNLMERKQYVIFAVFYSADYDEDEEGFRYNADIQYKIDADMWLEEIRENQIYDTGIDVEFGDEFITLTTCDRSRRRTGRFVAVARRIREGEVIQ